MFEDSGTAIGKVILIVDVIGVFWGLEYFSGNLRWLQVGEFILENQWSEGSESNVEEPGAEINILS